ncbi:MAG: hypothetical protein JW832_01005 [Deltaproteobacteria bacterium]|nr:hypothetical protein [Deltaproteobacteria bacterium]
MVKIFPPALLRNLTNGLKLLMLLFIGAMCWRAADKHIRYEPIIYDAAQNLTMAINFYNHGVFSLDASGSSVRPTAHRMPAYPFLLSFGMLFSFNRGEVQPIDVMQTTKPSLQAGINQLKSVNKAVFVLLAGLTFLAGYVLTRSYAVSLAACICLAQSRNLWENVNCFLTEGLTSLLLLGLSLGLAILLKARHRAFAYAAAGVLLAALALSNAVYFYFFPPALLLLWLEARSAGLTPLQMLRRISVFALAFALLTGAWMARNQYHFGRFYLTERGGGVLSGRAVYDTMTMSEYLASFLYWTPNDTAQRLLTRYFSPEDYRNIDREHENGYRARIIAREKELLKQTGSQVETDKLLVAEGWQALRKHFFKHLATTVPFAYRGIFVSPRLYLWNDIYLLKGTYVCYLLFLSLFMLTLHSLRARDAVLLAFLAPSLFSYAFFSFFTHNIARYNTPLLPVLWIAASIVLHRYIFRHMPGAAGRLYRYCRAAVRTKPEHG